MTWKLKCWFEYVGYLFHFTYKYTWVFVKRKTFFSVIVSYYFSAPVCASVLFPSQFVKRHSDVRLFRSTYELWRVSAVKIRSKNTKDMSVSHVSDRWLFKKYQIKFTIFGHNNIRFLNKQASFFHCVCIHNKYFKVLCCIQ